jgi:hypothetical protein
LLFDDLSGISCTAANGRRGSEYFIEMKTSECVNELAAFSQEFGKRRIRIIEMNLAGILFALTQVISSNSVR